MEWSSIWALGWIAAAFMLGYLLGNRSNEKAWCALFERLTNVMEKQAAALNGEEAAAEEENEEGEGWKRGQLD